MENNQYFKYEYTRYGRCEISLENTKVSITKHAATLLRKIDFSIYDWKLFKQKIYLKNEKLMDITNHIFEKDNCENKTIALCTIMAVIDKETFIDYLFFHAKRSFDKKWVHMLSYIYYHGFEKNRNSPGHVTVTNPKKSEIHFEFFNLINNVILKYINETNAELVVYPDFKKRNFLKLCYQGKWFNVTFDLRSHKFQEDMKLTRMLIDDIRYFIDNNESLRNLSNKYNINEGVVISYAFTVFEEDVIKYIKKMIRIQLHNNEQISIHKALGFHIKQVNHRLKRLKRDNELIYNKIQQVISFYQKKQLTHFNIYNKNIILKNFNQFKAGIIKRNTWYSQEYNFTSIKEEPIVYEIKSYLYYLLVKKSDISPISFILKFVSYVNDNFKVENLSASKILTEYMIRWLNSLDVDLNTKNGYKNYFSSFLNFLISVKLTNFNTLFNLPVPPKKNDMESIDIEQQSINYTEPLPEDVYIQIRTHSDKLSKYVKNAFLLISATGCRPGELSYITEESLSYDEKEKVFFLELFISKQSKAYGKKGTKAIRKIPIYDSDVIEGFNEQVELSREYRKLFDINSIFVRQSNAKNFQIKHYIISSKDLIREINILIEKYNICSDLESNLWKYSPYQMRAMIATLMVEKGHASEEIKAFFGWLSKSTSERAYAFVRKKKMMELNDSFFNEHFNISFDRSALEEYTKEEKEELFVELYIHYRIMEYGKCVRHPIMGECGKLQSAASCASCARLVTSIEYLPYWEKLYINQLDIVNKLETKLEEEGISKSIYEEWGEYKVELHRLDSYESLISSLKRKKV